MSARPRGWPWVVLGLKRRPQATADVRRAYARTLKTIDQATDIAGFAALREAYEAAMARMVTPDRAASAPTTNEAANMKAAEPAPPAPAAAALPAGPTEEDILDRLFNDLETENIVLSPAARLRLVLDHPLAREARHEDKVRWRLAAYLRQHRQFSDGSSILSLRISREMLRALDARFGWLSDFVAFRRDFGTDPDLMDLILERAGIDRTVPPPPKPRRTGWRKYVGYVQDYPVIGFLALSVSLKGLSELQHQAASAGQPTWIYDTFLSLIFGLIGLGFLGFVARLLATVVPLRFAVATVVWTSLGLFLALLRAGRIGGIGATDLPLMVWGLLTVAALTLLAIRAAAQVLPGWLSGLATRIRGRRGRR